MAYLIKRLGDDMIIVFCTNPLNTKEVDVDYQEEFIAATSTGLFQSVLIDFDELVYNNQAKRSVRYVPNQEVEVSAIYRGWMLRPQDYELLYNALKNKGIVLINTPEQYEYAHCFPNWYNDVLEYTPKSVCASVERIKANFDGVHSDLSIFGNSPLIVKDYVKSRKHEWNDACYICNANNKEEVKRVTNNFIDRQGENLVGEVVLREFIELVAIGNHPKSNMPLTREYRAFFVNGKWIMSLPYWAEVEYYGKDNKDGAEFIRKFENLKSEFYTIDYAVKKDGDFIVIEIGDGQVSGLPSTKNAKDFYSHLWQVLVGLNSIAEDIKPYKEHSVVQLNNDIKGTIINVYDANPPFYMIEVDEEIFDVAHCEIKRIILE